MAFTGTPTIVQITDSLVRITGVSLVAAAAGTISLAAVHGGAGQVKLPASFNPTSFKYDNIVIDLSESIQVSVNVVASDADNNSIRIAKTDNPFLCTITNDGASDTPGLEIYLRYH